MGADCIPGRRGGVRLPDLGRSEKASLVQLKTIMSSAQDGQFLSAMEALLMCPVPDPASSFEPWMLAEDYPSLGDTSMDPTGSGATSPLSAQFKALTKSVVSWEEGLSRSSKSSSGSGAMGAPAAGGGVPWESVSTLREGWSRCLLMVFQASTLRFLSCSPTLATVQGVEAEECLCAIQAYWAILRLPGSQAFGLFHAALMRRTLAAAKYWVELCTVSGVGAGGGVSAAAPVAALPSASSAAAATAVVVVGAVWAA